MDFAVVCFYAIAVAVVLLVDVVIAVAFAAEAAPTMHVKISLVWTI